MLKNIIQTINSRLLYFSLVVGFISASLIRNPLTQYFFEGKTFSGRNWPYKISVMIGLTIFILMATYVIGLFIRFLNQKIQIKKPVFQKINFYSIRIITIGVAMLAFYIAIRYANQPIIEIHGFRQTQTAITSYWMIQDGWKLAYETPVVGYPWSIPFEFPIYQSIVALITWIGNFPLDPVGRLVSFAFLIGCAWPARQIVKRLNLPAEIAWIFCALLWSSPLYIFWGRTFMIETAALFLTFSAVPYVFDLFAKSPNWKPVILMAFWGSLGALQKSTTAIPVLFILAIIVLIEHILKSGKKMPTWRKIIGVLIAFLLPVLIGLAWSAYADYVKQFNLVGKNLVTDNLTGWYFGTLKQRFDTDVLKLILWDRNLVQNAAGIFGVSLLTASLIWGNKQERLSIIACLAVFLAPILFFINVQRVHEYYQISSTLFLIAALAFSMGFLIRKTEINLPVIPVMMIIFVFFNLHEFQIGNSKALSDNVNASTNRIIALGGLIDHYTPANSAFVSFGLDWSSELGYYAKRKSMMVPNEQFDEVWDNPAKYLGELPLSAMVLCPNEPHPPSLEDFLSRPEIQSHPQIYEIYGCYLWLSDIDGIIYTSDGNPVTAIERVP